MLKLSLIIILTTATLAPAALAQPDTKQTYQSCSTIASELLTSTQLQQKGLKLEELYSTLPGLTASGKERLLSTFKQIEKEGLLSTYSTINSRYARCAKTVFQLQGKPKADSTESLFYFCAGENKLRYEFILAFAGGVKVEELAQKSPAQRRQLVYYMWDIYKQNGLFGLEALFDFSATELKRCLNQ